MTQEITLIDAGTGNLRSVHKALESLGANVNLTHDPEQVLRGGRLVLPGVGAFGDFMKGLRQRGLEQPILEIARRGDPLLGICVGMQAFFEVGEEMGEHRGLGLLAGRVVHFPPLGELKIPHTGWNQLQFQAPCLLWRGIENGDYAYFNHAYYCAPQDPNSITATTDYGIAFACAVQQNNLFGVQFHPEKSQRVGLKILENFIHNP
jgi:imidazole glycerol-phosphate synthase subunit HisH